MRIVVADYSGHPFQVQLSRELARRQHTVLHLYFSDFQTPRGRLATDANDPASLAIEPIALGTEFAKDRFFRRRFQEITVGRKFADRIGRFEPDVVVAANLPLDSLRMVAQRSLQSRHAFVFWQQDLYSVAIDGLLRGMLGLVGGLIGAHYRRMERSILHKSHAIVPISEGFLPILKRDFGVAMERVRVVENWAPLDEIPLRPKDNAWARANRLADKLVVLYSGTLGLKHDPGQILAVAQALRRRPDTAVVVCSEGRAADWLQRQADELNLDSLRVMGFQPFDVYPDVLATADVLLSILELSSGVFSVPSKVLSYLCAGRAIVLSAPLENLAAHVIERSGAGRVISAGDRDGLIEAVRAFLDDPEARTEAGRRGRCYADRAFDIHAIADHFETILSEAHETMLGRPPPAGDGAVETHDARHGT